MTLTASFVRRRHERDRVHVRRCDGTTAAWDFPSYGDRLPHDLVHLVVEDGLRLAGGFWDRVAAGASVRLVDNQATLVPAGPGPARHPNRGGEDLRRAEEAVAWLGPVGAGDRPAWLTGAAGADAAAEAVRRRLDELARRWRTLPDGGAIALTFEAPGGDGHGDGTNRR